MSKLTMISIWIALLFIVYSFVFFSVAFPGSRIIKRYDLNHNVIGYSKIENGRETRYNKEWQVEGYSIRHGNRTDYFTPIWDREGYDLYEGEPIEEGEY